MFQNRDVICFLGDSLTAAGLWEAEVYQRIGKSVDIKCYNAGISGGTARLASEYFYRTCLIYNPTHVVITFGINDIERELYSPDCTDPDREEKKALAIEEHKRCYEEIVTKILDFGAKVIVCPPPPYDEDGKFDTANLRCNSGLNKCAEFAREIAKKYSLPLVDFNRHFASLMKTRELIKFDRVHPNNDGYHAMAEIFLYELGLSDKIDLDTPFAIEKWNKKRLDIERKIEFLNFLDFILLYRISKINNWGFAEKLAEVKRRYDAFEDKCAFIPMTCKHYMENAHKRDEMINELISRTIYPRNGEK